MADLTPFTEGYVDQQHAADLLRVTKTTLRRYQREHPDLPRYKYGKAIWYKPEELFDWAERVLVKPVKGSAL